MKYTAQQLRKAQKEVQEQVSLQQPQGKKAQQQNLKALSTWLSAALAQHAADVKRGCLCPPPSQRGKMKFAPQSENCPIHGEASF